jgi:DNA-binding GntR family transcriptional regulator
MPIALRSERVYRELRRRVLMGLFNARDRLVEEKIATLLSVSRTPIREALVRLHADRLVDRYADGGYYVAVPDLAGLRDLYELRITLELRGLTRALEEPTYRHQTSVLEPLRDRWRRLRYDAPAPDAAFVEVDESFHVALSRSSGNHAITDMLETVNARIRPVRMHDFLTEDRIRLTIDQHLEIVEPVLIGEIDTAVQRLHRHVGESMEVVERRAARALTQMALRGRVPS